MSFQSNYDVAVIGGGVVGCAVVFELTRQGFSCVLLEKNPSIMSEASAGNSGMLHTGFDAPPSSLELKCIRLAQKSIHDVVRAFSLPFVRCGAHVIAWKKEHKTDMSKVLLKSDQNGLRSEVTEVSVSDVYKAEPYLSPGIQGALHIPNESVLDSGLLGVCLAQHAKLQGAQIFTNCAVTGVHGTTLATEKGPVRAGVVINCAGLHGDKVDRLAGTQNFSIQPRKGQYCVYGQQHSQMVKSIILPTPTEKTKGIAVFKSVYDNVIVGPTAEDVPQRTRPLFDGHVHTSLGAIAQSTVPRLAGIQPSGAYTGVRPATEFKDYQIHAYPSRNWLTVGGIRSTGVSACLGIAQYVSERLRTDLNQEPSLGPNKHLEDLHWQINGDRHSVSVNGCSYEMNHPIFLYGHQSTASKM